jgi:GTP-binding protein
MLFFVILLNVSTYIPKIAIVGRPNVGKSTFFNRVVGSRKAIVDDASGVTRDRLYAQGTWNGKDFNLIDTGGISNSDDVFVREIKEQAELAIEEADLIIFMVDGRTTITSEDQMVAKILYQTKKPVFLVVNRIDSPAQKDNIYDYYSLGLGEPFPVASIHGTGVADLLDKVVETLKTIPEENPTEEDIINLAIIGRPNVGKSSIFNSLINSNRSIVSDIQGTTRDAIDEYFVDDTGQSFRITDTAGIRKSGKIIENTEKYSVLRAQMAVEEADVILVVIDATTGIIEQDKHIAGLAINNGKAVIIVVNKWDVIEKDTKSMDDFTTKIRDEFKFLDFAPVLFVSALTRQRLNKIPETVRYVDNNHNLRIQSSQLNQAILDAIAIHPTPTRNLKRLRVYYATQVSTAPPTFIIFVNDPELMHFSYERFLENSIRNAFDFTGTPIKMRIRARK